MNHRLLVLEGRGDISPWGYLAFRAAAKVKPVRLGRRHRGRHTHTRVAWMSLKLDFHHDNTGYFIQKSGQNIIIYFKNSTTISVTPQPPWPTLHHFHQVSYPADPCCFLQSEHHYWLWIKLHLQSYFNFGLIEGQEQSRPPCLTCLHAQCYMQQTGCESCVMLKKHFTGKQVHC